MKTKITALIVALVFATCIYVDVQQRKAEEIEVKNVYPLKKVKDWNSEETRVSKRIWLESVNNSTKK